MPVFNVRMSNIIAALAIPQIKHIELTIEKINTNYTQLENLLSINNLIYFSSNNNDIRPVRDSVQLRIKLNEKKRIILKNKLNEAGIPISYFGGTNNTNARLYQNWKFMNISKAKLPNTKNH